MCNSVFVAPLSSVFDLQLVLGDNIDTLLEPPEGLVKPGSPGVLSGLSNSLLLLNHFRKLSRRDDRQQSQYSSLNAT